jgi:hypothetical protein
VKNGTQELGHWRWVRISSSPESKKEAPVETRRRRSSVGVQVPNKTAA